MNTLINKNFKQYDYICRYNGIPAYYNVEDGKYVQGTTGQLNQNISYVSHIVKEHDTFDSLSLHYYNSPLYYWAIMDFNQIQDSFVELKVGDVLKIPTLNALIFDIQ